MLNMTHVFQTMKAMGWKPPESGINLPPGDPDRNVRLPDAWAHLEKKRP
jgi:hypothetical protein